MESRLPSGGLCAGNSGMPGSASGATGVGVSAPSGGRWPWAMAAAPWMSVAVAMIAASASSGRAAMELILSLAMRLCEFLLNDLIALSVLIVCRWVAYDWTRKPVWAADKAAVGAR